MTRIGIVGAGSMGRYHASRWTRLPVELAGFYDLEGDRARQSANQFGGRSFPSLQALVDNVDAVVVTTPTHTHHQVVLDVAPAGKPIFCEKPLARHLADCEAMIATCEASGARLFVGQVVRFFPEYASSKAICDAGEIGQPGVMRATRGGAVPMSSSWYAEPAKSGGVILDLAIHDLDYALWCLGPAERVYALSMEPSEGADYALITVRHAGGAIAHVESSWAFPRGTFFTKLEIAGDGGLLESDNTSSMPLVARLSAEEGQPPKLAMPESPLAPEDDPYYVEDKHFLDCIESGEPFSVTPQEAMAAVTLALAATESARTGAAIRLAEYREVAQ